MKQRICIRAALGIATVAFGVGVLVSFFIPEPAIVIIEAAVILALGVLYYTQR